MALVLSMKGVQKEQTVTKAEREPVQKSMVIMLADGLEEVEFALPFDLCSRAGVRITLVAVPSRGSENKGDKLLITGSHQLEIRAQLALEGFLQQYHSGEATPDMVFLPGGMPGSKHLAENRSLIDFLRQYGRNLEAEQRYLAAICAAPAHVLGKAAGLLGGRKYTCYPGAEALVPGVLRAQKQEQALAEDGNIITGEGVGSAHLLAQRLIERLIGHDKAIEVMKAALYL
ncbi:DJ-1/PfpI family protein [Candidatus Haliotispira prima]|uniref:DJ-1/PfpI family protein n=1 Tax=Candidatus Haliotispira prima TaxID=3034016 RepID=A0ABY8MJW4_9SPIO|nr:DJ-1/PfpI family protein [Candidatus Haliotispira prima]